MSLKKLKPGVSKYWLIALAGAMWSVAGALLCRRAYGWFASISWTGAIPLELFGVLLALLAYRFNFSKIARKNIERLCRLTENTCLFAFQTWRGYLLIVLMMFLSGFLRRSPIPKPYLAVLYTAIGGALLLSSLSYYRLLWQWVVRKKTCEQ
jgi:hypothetical protein